MQEQILQLIRLGVSPTGAAQSVGIAPRTMRELLALGEGRSSRPATRKLIRFARRVRAAQAVAVAEAQIALFKKDPERWLRYAERFLPEDRDAQTSLRLSLDLRDFQDPVIRGELERVLEQVLEIEPAFVIPPHPDRDCSCIFHENREAGQ